MRLSEISIIKPTLYLDMDGVMCDFFGSWAKLEGVKNYTNISDKSISLDKVGEIAEEFFATLPVLPGLTELLKATEDFGGYTILSSPLRGYFKESIAGKNIWIKKHLSGHAPNHIIFSAEKHKYATKENVQNILIDDYGVNIVAWNKAGGVAFKHAYTNIAATLNWLKELNN